MATHPGVLAWRIPMDSGAWGCSPWGHRGLDLTEHTHLRRRKVRPVCRLGRETCSPPRPPVLPASPPVLPSQPLQRPLPPSMFIFKGL